MTVEAAGVTVEGAAGMTVGGWAGWQGVRRNDKGIGRDGRGMSGDGRDGGGWDGRQRDWAGRQNGLIRYIALFPADGCRPQPLLRGQLLDGLAHLRVAVPAEVVHYFAGGLGAGAV